MSNMKVKCERKWYYHFGIYMQVMQPCCITCCLIVAIIVNNYVAIWMVVYEIVNISLYIKFVPSRLKTLLITKQDVVEEIK